MSSEKLLKEKLPTPNQMSVLMRFVEHGSLAGAFGPDKAAQGTATQRLNQIDALLGIRTREKAGQGKAPSAEAVEVARYCRDFLQRLADFKATTSGRPNEFRIGAGDSLSFYLLIPSLTLSPDWAPKVEIHLSNLRSREIVAKLLDGTLDFGLVREDAIGERQTRQRLRFKHVCMIDYEFCVREDMLAKFSGNRADEASLLAWCVEHLPLASFYSEMSEFTKALGKAKLKWPVNLRCSSFPQVKEAVEAGGYCGILPSIAFKKSSESGVVRFGRGMLTAARRKVVLVWSPSLTERRQGGEVALRELQAALRQHCA